MQQAPRSRPAPPLSSRTRPSGGAFRASCSPGMELSAVPGLTQLLLLPLLALRLSAGDCPCSDAALCRPIRHYPDFEVSTLSAQRSGTRGQKRSRGAHSSVNHPSLQSRRELWAQGLGGFPGRCLSSSPTVSPKLAPVPASSASCGEGRRSGAPDILLTFTLDAD